MAEVYRIENLKNGKLYFGITSGTTRRRWYLHRYRAAKQDTNSRLHAAIRKYGRDAFKVTTLVVADWDYACDLERKLIKAYDTVETGYNATYGGEGSLGCKQTDEAREKKRKAMLGRKMGEAHGRATSAGKKGKKPKMPEGFDHGYWRGKKQSEEMIAKRVASLKAKPRSPEGEARRVAGIRARWARIKGAA